MRNNASIKTYKPIMNNFKQNFEHLEEILKNEKKKCPREDSLYYWSREKVLLPGWFYMIQKSETNIEYLVTGIMSSLGAGAWHSS